MGARALQGRIGGRSGAPRSRLPGAARRAEPPRWPGSAGGADPGDLRVRHLVLPVDRPARVAAVPPTLQIPPPDQVAAGAGGEAKASAPVPAAEPVPAIKAPVNSP